MSVFRYGYDNAAIPALIACHTRQQASDLLEFLRAHRPAGTPEPRLILSETPRLERAESLARFEHGERSAVAVDTLIQVGVLIAGWSSPRCKLLIDLAPSLSRVRSTQKYFRVMTRDGGREARIFLLLPQLAVDRGVSLERIRQIATRGAVNLRGYFRSHYLDQAERAGEGLHRDPPCHSRMLMARSGINSRYKRHPVWGFLYDEDTQQVREIPPATYLCSCGYRLTFSPRALHCPPE